jgi:hypothetical protein
VRISKRSVQGPSQPLRNSCLTVRSNLPLANRLDAKGWNELLETNEMERTVAQQLRNVFVRTFR